MLLMPSSLLPVRPVCITSHTDTSQRQVQVENRPDHPTQICIIVLPELPSNGLSQAGYFPPLRSAVHNGGYSAYTAVTTSFNMTSFEYTARPHHYRPHTLAEVVRNGSPYGRCHHYVHRKKNNGMPPVDANCLTISQFSATAVLSASRMRRHW